jgi:hypothetical protein
MRSMTNLGVTQLMPYSRLLCTTMYVHTLHLPAHPLQYFVILRNSSLAVWGSVRLYQSPRASFSAGPVVGCSLRQITPIVIQPNPT